MAEAIFLVNKNTKRRFRVVDRNPTENTITIQLEDEQGNVTGAPFVEKFDKAMLLRLGYEPVKVQE